MLITAKIMILDYSEPYFSSVPYIIQMFSYYFSISNIQMDRCIHHIIICRCEKVCVRSLKSGQTQEKSILRLDGFLKLTESKVYTIESGWWDQSSYFLHFWVPLEVNHDQKTHFFKILPFWSFIPRFSL